MLVQVTGSPSGCFPAPTCGCKDPWAVWFGTDQPPCASQGPFPINAHPGAPLHHRIHWAVTINLVPQLSHQRPAALTQTASAEMKRKHPVKRFLWGQYSARAQQTSSKSPESEAEGILPPGGQLLLPPGFIIPIAALVSLRAGASA